MEEQCARQAPHGLQRPQGPRVMSEKMVATHAICPRRRGPTGKGTKRIARKFGCKQSSTTPLGPLFFPLRAAAQSFRPPLKPEGITGALKLHLLGEYLSGLSLNHLADVRGCGNRVSMETQKATARKTATPWNKRASAETQKAIAKVLGKRAPTEVQKSTAKKTAKLLGKCAPTGDEEGHCEVIGQACLHEYAEGRSAADCE